MANHFVVVIVGGVLLLFPCAVREQVSSTGLDATIPIMKTVMPRTSPIKVRRGPNDRTKNCDKQHLIDVEPSGGQDSAVSTAKKRHRTHNCIKILDAAFQHRIVISKEGFGSSFQGVVQVRKHSSRLHPTPFVSRRPVFHLQFPTRLNPQM